MGDYSNSWSLFHRAIEEEEKTAACRLHLGQNPKNSPYIIASCKYGAATAAAREGDIDSQRALPSLYKELLLRRPGTRLDRLYIPIASLAPPD